jgi:hypothetical protein
VIVEHVPLTAKHKATIKSVFDRHRLSLPPERLDWLCKRIERAWAWWAACNSMPTTRATAREMRAEVGALFRALKKLSGNTVDVLRWHALETDVFRIADKTRRIPGLIEAMQNEEDGMEPQEVFFDVAFRLLYEACASAGSGESLPYYGGAASAEEALAAKAGRPPAGGDAELVRELASAYRIATGRKATDTPAGPFDDLVSAVFDIVQPGKERTGFRRLIRNALGYGMSRKGRQKS